MRKFTQSIGLVFIACVFAIFLFAPLYRVLRVAFFGVDSSTGFTLAYLGAIFQDRALREGLLNSAIIAVGVTFVCTLISVPLALINVRFDFIGKRWASALLLVPLVLPPFVGAIGMRQILGRFGVLTSVAQHLHFIAPGEPVDWFGGSSVFGARIWGIILLESLSLYPILFLNVSAALANLDPAMEQAAANLGASRWRIFRKITLPLMRPGLFAGATIVMIWSFTELGTPLMFEFYRVTPVQIFFRLTQVSSSPIPFALVVVMLIGSAMLYTIGKLVLGRGHSAGASKATTASTARVLRGGESLLALAPFLVLISLAILPHIAVVLISVSGVGAWYQSAIPRVFTLQHYAHALTHDLAIPSIGNSVMFASFSTLIDIGLGIAIGWLIVRSTLSAFARQAIDALSMLPLAVPGLVLAFGYLAISLQMQTWFSGHRALRDWVDVQENPTLLLVAAYAIRRLPYVVRSVVAGLQQTPVDLELAARNLGASSFLTLRKITAPLIAANLIAGALLAFSFAMLEVSDSLILAQKQTHWPITKAIYELFGRLGDGPYIASALGVWAMVLLMLTLLAANSMLGKRMGAIFRI